MSKTSIPLFSADLQHLQQIVNAIEDVNHNQILQQSIQDLSEAKRSEIYLIPIAHHSVAAAIKTRQILEKRKPSIVFIEISSDFQPYTDDLLVSIPPVAFNAISYNVPGIPKEILPVSLQSPFNEFSAEYQAIKYAEEYQVPIQFVDASCGDLITFKSQLGQQSSTIVMDQGDLKPSEHLFIQSLLDHTRSANFSEFWLNVMESNLLSATFGEYRMQMFFLGSIFRRLGHNAVKQSVLNFRDRIMWRNISNQLQASKIDPDDAIFVLGAAHAVPVITEFGRVSKRKAVQNNSPGHWSIGLIESSFTAIDTQYYDIPGATAQKAELWQTYKSVKPGTSVSIKTFSHDRLLKWSIDIVKLARKEGYITSIADSIAIVEIYYRLAELRGKSFLSKMDFMEAAITCLDKNDPGLTPIAEIFSSYFQFSDKRGSVNFKALPPLAKNVITSLSEYGFQYNSKRVQRFLLDFKKEPEKEEFSDMLWKLQKLEVNVTPIMGTRELGKRNLQESWDVYISKDVNPLITLSQQGFTLNEILKQQLKKRLERQHNTAEKLNILKEALLYLPNYEHFHQFISLQIVDTIDDTALYDDNLYFYLQVRELLNYFRGQSSGLPKYFKQFLLEIYEIFCRVLPHSFTKPNVGLRTLIGIISFIQQFEATIIAEGGTREEFKVAMSLVNVNTLEPAKYAIHTVANSKYNTSKLNTIRTIFYNTYSNPITLNKIPSIIEGLLYSTYFSSSIYYLVGELLDQTFRRLDNHMLARWLPSLIELFEELDPSMLTQLSTIVLDAYLDKEITLWYDQSMYDSGDFDTISVQSTETVTTGDRYHSSAGLIHSYHHAAVDLSTLLGLAWTPVASTYNHPPDMLFKTYPVTAGQLASLLGLSKLNASDRSLTDIYYDATTQLHSLIGSS